MVRPSAAASSPGPRAVFPRSQVPSSVSSPVRANRPVNSIMVMTIGIPASSRSWTMNTTDGSAPTWRRIRAPSGTNRTAKAPYP